MTATVTLDDRSRPRDSPWPRIVLLPTHRCEALAIPFQKNSRLVVTFSADQPHGKGMNVYAGHFLPSVTICAIHLPGYFPYFRHLSTPHMKTPRAR